MPTCSECLEEVESVDGEGVCPECREVFENDAALTDDEFETALADSSEEE